MISQRTIDAIRERAQILELISETREVKRSGSNFVCLCPFHPEKSPSCHIRPGENTFYCFGCQAGGNVFSYVMRHEGVSFPEAIEILARRYGIAVERVGSSEKRRDNNEVSRQVLFDLHRFAQAFYVRSLASAPSAVLDYIRSRGLTDEALSRFGIGYAPAERHSLVAALQQAGVGQEAMLASGLVRRSASGALYDIFRGRLQFPIFIDSTRVVAFGGRVIPGLSDKPEGDYTPPKYLNSPETSIYRKQSVLFGLPQALAAIRVSREVYLVEGYMDVVSLALAGVEGVVATCGTATTPSHLQRLSSLVKRIVTVFDGDRAGREAAARAFKVLCNAPLELAAVFLSEGEDPDSFARRHGPDTPEALSALPQVPLADAFTDSLVRPYGVASPSELGASAKAAVAREVVKVIQSVVDPIARAEFLKWAAFSLGIDEKLLVVSSNDSPSSGTSDFAVVGGAARSRKPTVLPGGTHSVKTAGASFYSSLGESLESGGLLRPGGEGASPTRSAVEAPFLGGNSSTWPEISALPPLDQEIIRCAMGLSGALPVAIEEDSSITHILEPATLFFLAELKRIFELDCSVSQRKELLGWLLRECGASWVALWKLAYKMRESKEVDFSRVFEGCYRKLREQVIRDRLTVIEQEMLETSDVERRIELAQMRLEVEREARRVVSGENSDYIGS